MAPMEGIPVLATVEKEKDLSHGLRGLAGVPPPPYNTHRQCPVQWVPQLTSLTLQEPLRTPTPMHRLLKDFRGTQTLLLLAALKK